MFNAFKRIDVVIVFIANDVISLRQRHIDPVVNGHGSHGNGSWGACSTVGGVASVVGRVMNLRCRGSRTAAARR